MQIERPKLPPCRHLFCEGCGRKRVVATYFSCPLDDLRSPEHLLTTSEQLQSLKADFISGLDSLNTEDPSDLIYPCLDNILSTIYLLIRTDFVKCRLSMCVYPDCHFIHSLNRSIPPTLANPGYFELSEPEKNWEYDVVDGGSEEDMFEDLSKSANLQISR